MTIFQCQLNKRLVGVMVSVLASIEVGSNQRLIELIFVASPLSSHHYGVRAKIDWLGIRIMCPSEATCLPADCCLNELSQ